MLLAVRLSVFPTQRGLLLPAAGAAGLVFIITEVVPAKPVQPFSVAVTEYVPAAATVAAVITGFWDGSE